MPFTVTHERPKIDSTVTVKFAGLLLLQPNGDKILDVGINRQAPEHSFQVMLIVDKPHLPLTLLRLTSGPLTGDLKITHKSDDAAFKVFTKDENPFDPLDPNGDNDPLDYRWALNMKDFHPGLKFNDGARPIATLNDGVLYTSNLCRPSIGPQLVTPGATPPEKDLNRIASDLAASFDLKKEVEISWEEAGKAKRFTIPRVETVDPPGTTYTIVVLNNPPATDPSPHDELAFYYLVLEDDAGSIPEGNHRKLIYKDPSKSDEIPCLSVILNP